MVCHFVQGQKLKATKGLKLILMKKNRLTLFCCKL